MGLHLKHSVLAWQDDLSKNLGKLTSRSVCEGDVENESLVHASFRKKETNQTEESVALGRPRGPKNPYKVMRHLVCSLGDAKEKS